MKDDGKIEKAARLFKDFTGHTAQHVDYGPAPRVDDTQIRVGELEAVAYNAVRDGEKASYIHEFSKRSRPLLTASHDGHQLYFLGGRYRFTDRGIVDMAGSEIALVNPSRRRRKSRHHRTAAQKAATRKMIAARRASLRHHNPSRRRRRRNAWPDSPRRHRAAALKGWARRRRTRVRRRNPDGIGDITNMLIPAATGAAGALGVDLLVGYLPLPAQLQTGIARRLTVLAGALGLGWAAGKFINRRTGAAVTAGAMTVVLYDWFKSLIIQQFPNAPLVPTATVVVPTSATATPTVMGAREDSAIGYVSPAAQLGMEPWIYTGDEMRGMDAYVEGDGMGAYVRAY